MLRTSRHNTCISPCLAQRLKLVSSSFSCWDFLATLYPLAITSVAFLRRFCSHIQKVDSETPYEVTQGAFESVFLPTIDIFPKCSQCLLTSTSSRAKPTNTEFMTTFSPPLKVIFTIRTRTFKKNKLPGRERRMRDGMQRRYCQEEKEEGRQSWKRHCTRL